uniref:Pus10 N-terminal eukaryotes domain-containing protein n=1 Tax=Oncorhynchus mykiss TaxID=8022 RepID=A0A8C7T6V2_ONCMY
MLPLKEKYRPIVKKLLEAGCCARCVLRFCCLGVQSAKNYQFDTMVLSVSLPAQLSVREVSGYIVGLS